MGNDDKGVLRRSDQILIDAPVGAVWSVLTDIPSWPACSTHVETHESWAGLLPRVFPGYLGRTLAEALSGALAALKAEAERRAGQSA